MEESLCNYQFRNPYFEARDRSSAHASLLAALISAGSVLRGVVLYPRTDDAEVTANFIGIAPVVEGPVVAAADSR